MSPFTHVPPIKIDEAVIFWRTREPNRVKFSLKIGEESKEPAPEVPKPAAKPARQISARLDNLSKPKRTSEIGLQNNAARQRSFSHEDAKVYRGRSVAKPQES